MASGREADGLPGTPASPRGGAGGRVQRRATQLGVSTLGRSWGKKPLRRQPRGDTR